MNLRSLLGLVPAEARLTGYLALDVERYAPSPSAFRRWDGDFWATATADGPRLGRARYCTLLPGARRQEPQGSSFPGRAMGTRERHARSPKRNHQKRIRFRFLRFVSKNGAADYSRASAAKRRSSGRRSTFILGSLQVSTYCCASRESPSAPMPVASKNL
jgi:hypothetical protein